MSRPRGRPPRSRGVFSFEDLQIELPSRAALDTSFVIAALVEMQRHHGAAADYLAALAGAGTTIVYNRLLLLELEEAAFKIALRERHGRNWQGQRHDGRVRRRASRLAGDVRSAWTAALEGFTSVGVAVEDVLPDVPDLMTAYGLASYDAVHAATAITLGGGNLVTTDRGFADVRPDELTLYVDGGGVRSCRARRPPARRS